MSEGRTLVLGLIAGVTIFLGLPLGRLRTPRPRLQQFLNALATGILIFLVWDVLSNAYGPIDTALGRVHDGTGGVGPVLGYGALFFGGIGVGLLGLFYWEQWIGRLARRQQRGGPGAMARTEIGARGIASWSPSHRLALIIAVGIGLHNFGEGLAIGESAAKGAIGLATVLVIGFALHNATEGFGIVAPFAADESRPGWRFLIPMGLIGGGPTFVGAAVGHEFTSDAVSIVFLTLAAGSILYVVVQLLKVAIRSGYARQLYWGLFAGLLAGFITDMVVSAGGA